MEKILPVRDYHAIEERYKRNGALSAKKLRQYIPVMFVNNLSVLLLLSVDGLVVGNLVSSDALAAVNIFYPATILIGVASVLIGCGAGISIARAVGIGDYDTLRKVKSAIKRLTIILAIAMFIIQIPLVTAIITSYDMDEDMTMLTWQYAVGIMIATPFGLCSTVGTYQLQATGNMHWLMRLSIMEGLVNLGLDLLFVGPCHMGVLGASLGTACANVLRCTATIIILAKFTDVYKTGKVKPGIKTYKAVLINGAPDALGSLMTALESYILMQMVIDTFGDEGGVIMGACLFCCNLVFVLTRSIKSATLPLFGILTGARDWDGLRIVFRQCLRLIILITGIMTTAIIIFPQVFYSLLGVKEIPDAGELCLRFYALSLVIAGCNSLFMQYYVNRKDSKYASSISIIENVSLVLIAAFLNMTFPPEIFWLSFVLNELIVLIINFKRYLKWIKQDKKELESLIGVLSLAVSPKEAVKASSKVEAYAKEKHISSRLTYRVSLCIEEMAAYAEATNKKKDILISTNIRFEKNGAILTFLDDGKCIALNEDHAQQRKIINNYELIKCVASEVSYQYVLNMNYTVIKFDDKPLGKKQTIDKADH